MTPDASERRSTQLGVWIVVALVGLAAVALFLPIASCPNCLGEGHVDPKVNEQWIRSHPGMLLHGRNVQRLGRATCIRCDGRGRVTTLGRLAQ